MSSSPPLAIPDRARRANQTFLEGRRSLTEKIVARRGGLELATDLQALTDRWITTLWATALPGQLSQAASLYAIGGYGRSELALHSDVDLLIAVGEPALIEDDSFSLAIERLMAWSRQTRVAVSHAVRTPEQTLRALAEDQRTPIALLDMRHLAGPLARSDAFSSEFVVDHLRGDDGGRSFTKALIEGLRARIARHGQTVFLLEPDLKAGEGGLRDLNCIAWAARVRWQLDVRSDVDESIGWTAEHRRDYCRRLDELLGLRNRLHLLRRRKQDRLTFREQERLVRLAELRGVSDLDDALQAVDRARNQDSRSETDRQARDALYGAIESGMGDYYRRARAISTSCERFLRLWAAKEVPAPEREGPFEVQGDQLSMAAGEELSDQAVFEALELAGERDLLLGPRLEARIEARVASWPAGDEAPRKLARRLAGLLVSRQAAPRTSGRLLQLGILSRIVPEFEPLICHVQHDLYHVFTTDIHSLKCLEAGRTLLVEDRQRNQWPIFSDIAAEIDDDETFLLACLFHDIGKNRGGGHSEKGAVMMSDIGPRLGLSSEQTEQLATLIAHHLLLSETSRRRDISDPEILDELADIVGSPQTLARLTALTYCDMATVGPEVLNDWSASLLIELYRRLQEVLRRRRVPVAAPQTPSSEERLAQRERLEQVIASGDPTVMDLVDEFVDQIPLEHLKNTATGEVLRQFDTFRRAVDDEDGVAVSARPLNERAVTELIVSGPDRPGTVARIAGAIASVGINIMAADIITTDSGRALDIFHVAHFNPRAVPPDRPRPVDSQRRLERLKTRIVDVLTGGVDIDELLARRLEEQRLEPRPVPAVPTEVHVDDEVSSRYTVVEVRAPDRQGLLYLIARTLLESRVNTKISRVDSLGSQAIDAFYVEECDGSPLSPQRTDEIVAALRRALTEE